MRRVRDLHVALALLLAMAACGGSDSTGEGGSATSPSGEDGPVPLVVDTDLAGDDIVALAYLASDPRVDLLAVSVAGTGEVTCPRGAEIAAALLIELGRPDVPVACGVSDPLSGERQFPADWREAADGAWELPLPEVAVPEDAPDAVALLAEELADATQPVTVLTLGPLTDVAQLLTEEPDVIETIARVVIMGGAVGVPGNVELGDATTPLDAEWNFYVDPRAADIVVASGTPVTLVALDATNGVPVPDGALELLAANDVTAATAVTRHLFERFPPPYLWDPLAAIAVTDPDLLPSREVTLDVVTEGAEAGRTIEQSGGARVELVEAPDDPGAIVTHLVEVLAGVEPGELVSPTTLPAAPTIGDVTISFDGSVCRYEGPDAPVAGNYLVDLRPGPVPFWGTVVHLAPGTTLEEVAAWVVEHPDEQPPMIEDVATIGDGVLEPPANVEFRADTVGVACITENGTIHIATTLQVAP
jgi:inosine-uridine nucleoside N-ribohydrolase